MTLYPRSSNAESARPPLPSRNAHIYFSTRHETHYAFTNISTHPIRYQGNLYLTAEHLYQALKVCSFRIDWYFWLTVLQFLQHQPAIADLVMNSNNPKNVAELYSDRQRHDWPQAHLFMLEQVLTLKFSQYPGLKMELMATGEAQLVQVCFLPKTHIFQQADQLFLLQLGSDQYWSQQENGSGRNEFGNILMRVRSTLRSQN
jgi:predicted NAD-dependent protein-ADP-ribosyltransferase YbiA (DUF1768 family)